MRSKEELREECSRLFACDSIHDSYELIDIYSELLFNIIRNHHDEAVYTQADADAKIVVQMMLTKSLHLRSAVNGITYQSKDGTTLNKIIDPTIVASLIRNIYETVGMFNLIYRTTKTKDEKTILYFLWVHAGLKYRQRFEPAIISDENRKKMEHEKKEMERIVQIIEETELYKKLDEKNQGKIKTKLKDRDYLIRINDTEVEFLSWQELTSVMGIKDGRLDNMYTYFSLYSHPSNVAVFQFADLFKKEDESFLKMTNFNLKNYFNLMSIFISDYIKLFPSVQKSFDSMDIRDQIVINFFSTFMRGDSYSINDSNKAVD